MKRIAALLLALCLLMTAASALADVDITYLEENPDVFRVQKGDTLTYVCSTLSAADLAFEHAYSNGKLYSFTCFSLLIPNGSDVVYPVLDVIYCADAPLNITTVSIEVGDVQYTFAVSSDGPAQNENGVSEDCMILFGVENFEFLEALSNEMAACKTEEDLLTHKYKATLRGDEEVTTTFSGAFLLDFYLIIVEAFTEVGGLSEVSQLSGASTMMTDSIPQE